MGLRRVVRDNESAAMFFVEAACFVVERYEAIVLAFDLDLGSSIGSEFSLHGDAHSIRTLGLVENTSPSWLLKVKLTPPWSLALASSVVILAKS